MLWPRSQLIVAIMCTPLYSLHKHTAVHSFSFLFLSSLLPRLSNLIFSCCYRSLLFFPGVEILKAWGMEKEWMLGEVGKDEPPLTILPPCTHPQPLHLPRVCASLKAKLKALATCIHVQLKAPPLWPRRNSCTDSVLSVPLSCCGEGHGGSSSVTILHPPDTHTEALDTHTHRH